MGEGAALAEGFRARIVGEARTPTTAADTVEAALAMRAEGATLILFAGGDGTARDLHGAVGESVAMLGIPTGVKMHSGVFAIAPEAAGRLAVRFAADEGGRIETVLCEIMDVDEAALRQGRLAGRLYGYGRVPCERNLVQAAKRTGSGDDEAATDGAALEISRAMAPGIAYVVGPGRTAKKVLAALGLEGTLLGVDLVIDGRLAGADLGEAEILALAGDHPLHVIVGVTGGQGFVFGRGNQPISPAVIRRAGGLTILAGPAKLAGLADCRLLVDTGDASLDAALSGYRRVVTGPGEETVMRLAAG
jgi:predicted polyphosphate/ATP-dependent NAD kinase